MTESKDQTDKKAKVGARKQLSLQRTVESGHVQQNFSHGRKKSVVVEKKRSRKLSPPSADATADTTPTAPAKKEAAAPAQKATPKNAPSSSAAVAKAPPSNEARNGPDGLSTEERDARTRALAAARADSSSKASKVDTVKFESVRPPEPPPAEKPAEAAEPAPEPVEAKKPDSKRRPKSGESQTEVPGGGRGSGRTANTANMPREGGRPREINIPSPSHMGAPDSEAAVEKPSRANRAVVQPRNVDEDEDKRKRGAGVKTPRSPVRAGDSGRQRQKLTITNFDRESQQRSLASLKRKREKEKLKAMGVQQPREKISREVIIPEAITIQELSNRMTERGVDVIKFLMKEGAMHKITDVIDADTAELIVEEFGHTAKRVSESDVEIGFTGAPDDDPDKLKPRAPVVTIMGHVDHGKTSLLDAVRSANVVSGEAGGITQHIGAYQVQASNGEKITFIDTPGHEAFTAMRARGAKVTDIVVLVVAADDGVMPQTIEAINHAKAAEVPMIVAINKIDKPQADPKRVQTDLLQHDVVVESMGGETLEVPVSALKGTNLDKLLEAIRLQAELLDLTANPDRNAEGIVIEAKLERGRGPVGTVLVQRGTLKVGDIIVAGTAWGRVRALIDDLGSNVAKAGPSVPVEVLGFDYAPEAGDLIAVVENEARAREITDYRLRKRRETLGAAGSKSSLEQMMQQLKDAELQEFPLVVKGDVQGSVEAIAGALSKVGNEEVQARIIHGAVGGITESDIALASASNAIVIGFNVRANAQAKTAADSQGIEIRYYNIIYDLVDDVKAAMSGLLAPTRRENFLGYATIKQVFNISKAGKVAGCVVTEGKVERGAKVRLLRDNVVIHEGTLSILKRFKDDVKEVNTGQECGMSFANYQDIREGDQIECFQVETIARTL